LKYILNSQDTFLFSPELWHER